MGKKGREKRNNKVLRDHVRDRVVVRDHAKDRIVVRDHARNGIVVRDHTGDNGERSCPTESNHLVA